MRNRWKPGFLSTAFGPATSRITSEPLSRGTHANPYCGGKVLKPASVLAGERWSTHPESALPALAAVAGTVNDLLADDHTGRADHSARDLARGRATRAVRLDAYLAYVLIALVALLAVVTALA
jgi:hypothetical protein